MISFKNKHNRWAGLICCGFVSALMGLTACSDWDDHYEANSSITDSQQASLWENIEKHPELSQFATLLQKVGYDDKLGATQTYTVWAPVNGSFDYDQLMATGNDRLLRQFIQNHIARNNYPVSGTVDRKVYMLNEKMMLFKGDGNYTIQNVELSQANLGSNNGTVHTLKTKIPFMENIYESLNNEQFQLDSISNYYHSYDVSTLDEAKSVSGPVVNGEQTYLDSIYTEDNDLYRTFRAYINREDSNYAMVLPTNAAWSNARNLIKQYYHYVPKFRFIETTPTGVDSTVVVELKDADQLNDSITNYMLVKDLAFNINIGDNQRLQKLEQGESLQCDSVFSTTGSIFYADDAKAIFDNTTRVSKSNGLVWIADKLNMPSWTSWNPEIIVEADNWLMKSLNVGEAKKIDFNINNQNPDISGKVLNNTYFEAKPNAPSDNPDLYFHLPNIRSAEYDLYVVMIPGNITSTLTEYKPNSFSASIRTTDASGTLKAETTLKNPVDDKTTFTTSDEAKIDTVYLGSFTFPICYYGTGKNYPYLRIRCRFNSSQASKFDRTLRVDCIILRPKELSTYLESLTEEQRKQYKYDKGIY